MNIRQTMNRFKFAVLVLLPVMILTSCSAEPPAVATEGHEAAAPADFARGPHNGRLLEDGDFALELAIFETGVPPEFHAWATNQGAQLQPTDFTLTVTLRRLGNVVNNITFAPQADYLRSTSTVYEPHSFVVAVDATYKGERHHWDYESFEGRTSISPELSQSLGIETSVAGPAVLEQKIEALGVIAANTDYTRKIHARFDGLVQSVAVTLGQRVARGDALLVIESNESLKPYTVTAPIAGLITQRNINPGEQTDGQMLIEIVDSSQVWAELAIFPSDRPLVQVGAPVTITHANGTESVEGTIAGFAAEVGAGQTTTARVQLANTNNMFVPGTFITGTINTGEQTVPIAVKRDGLQSFRDFTVVFAKVGNEYEVRMLELGRQDDDMIEVLGGLEAGTEYVSANSYIIKADIEKSGASHDH
jgi:membrane fusion protein, heavy metal efflux system